MEAQATQFLEAVYILGALLLMTGAFVARRPLKLNGIAIVVSCVVSTAIPILFLVLAWSLHSRFDRYYLEASKSKAEEAAPSEPVIRLQTTSDTNPLERFDARIGRLERLTTLWKDGALTDVEFQREKDRLS